jgi:transglutaminase-like putative cysteine protease
MRSHPKDRGQAADSALAAIATLTAAWPISTLLAEGTWLRGAVPILAVIALSGVGARSLGLRGLQVPFVQLLCFSLAASAIYGREHLWHGLPTMQTLGFADGLVTEALASARHYSAPAPSTPGLVFVTGCALGLAALVVDYLAVTRRSPAVAGLPLLTVFLFAVANRGFTMPVIFFLTAAAMWLILVARTDRTILRRWSTTVAVSHQPVPQNLGPPGVREYASMARMLGTVALVAAVAVPAMLPQSSPRFLGSGIGRNSSGNGNGITTVGFSQSLDLAADLKDRSKAPVLQYTTEDTSPPPLRVAVGAYYRPDPGVWLPSGRPWRSSEGQAELSPSPKVQEPAGLSPEVPKQTFTMDVRRNLLEDPYLAAPYPLTGANLGGIAWGADYETQSIRVAARPDSYSVAYWDLQPTKAILRSSPPISEHTRNLFSLDLTLDGPYVGRVTALTKRLTSGINSAYDKAMAIQQYLRTDGGFTYSLILAPPVKNASGKNAGDDSLTNFLITKQGYCVQFATAMVMMSRAAGIPARMDLGFLPGSEAKGVWTVVAADAHAWPELYLEGIGWTRFEPTPSRGAPPAYAIPVTPPGNVFDGGALTRASAQTPRLTPRKDLGAPSSGNGASPKVSLTPTSALRWLTHGWGSALLTALIAILGALLVPTAALWRRRRSISTAHTNSERVEAQWELLTSSLNDLGIWTAPARTPRQLRTYYDHAASLGGAPSEALGRVVQALELSRYAPPAARLDDLSSDARQVIKAAAASRQAKDRFRAAMWPGSGLTQLRSSAAQVAGAVRTLGGRLSAVLHRRSARPHATDSRTTADVPLEHH